MNNNDIPQAFESGLATLTEGAIKQALNCKDPQEFLDWMRNVATRQYPDVFPEEAGESVRQLATQLGSSLWNALPQPNNGLRPRPMPPPGRNDPCPCGSGKKYKRCCAMLPPIPHLDSEELLPIVIDQLGPSQLEKALAAPRLPPETIAQIALRLLDEDDRPQRARQILEPMFQGKLQRLDHRHGPAMNVLCDVYDRLGHRNKKRAFLEHLCHEAGRQLQAEAWQRLTTIYQDVNDFDQARNAFHQAQRADPDDPNLSILEVTLLLGEERTEEAVARARFWHGRLRRMGLDETPLLDWLGAVINDPMGTLTDTYGSHLTPGIERLREWLQLFTGRSLPNCRIDISTPEDADTDDFEQGTLPLFDNDGENEDESDSMENRPWATLEPLQEPGKVEREWEKVFPAASLFAGDFAADDPWHPELTETWLGFLFDNPVAIDSLSILDDLRDAVVSSGAASEPWGRQALLYPILERAHSIFQKAWREVPEDTCLPWGILQNRPILQLLAHHAYSLMHQGEQDSAQTLFEQLLHINPDDNQGVRTELMNLYLVNGDDPAALALAARYSDDTFPELCFGRVLALYRSGRNNAARDALHRAESFHPHVRRLLLARNPRPPKEESQHGILMGGEEQAWMYRQATVDVWRAVPGLLQWLRAEKKR